MENNVFNMLERFLRVSMLSSLTSCTWAGSPNHMLLPAPPSNSQDSSSTVGALGKWSSSTAPHKAWPIHRFRPSPLLCILSQQSRAQQSMWHPHPSCWRHSRALLCSYTLFGSSYSFLHVLVHWPCCFCMVVKSSKVRVRTGGLQKA